MAKSKIFPSLILSIGILGSSYAFGAVPEVSGLTIANNTPKVISSAKKLGAVDSSTVIEVSIWLKPHNKAEMDALAKDLYDPTSKNFRRFLTKSEFMQRFAPTADEAKKVQNFFTSNGLKVVKTGPDNYYVRGSGTAAAVSSAFGVSLANFQVDGKTVRSNTADPHIKGEAASLVNAVAGLDTLGVTHPLDRWTSLRSKDSATKNTVSTAGVSPNLLPASAFNTNCFPGTTTESFTTDGGLPSATYTGVKYTSNPSTCGYTPANIRAAYNLNALYSEGYDGTGQTIVIIDWCGSPTITQDANAFSAQFGLPKLTSANFNIIPTGISYCSGPDAEINLDVEWAHAIAPGATIDLVVPPAAYFQDIDQAVFYAVDEQLGNVLSGSYGSEEYYTEPSELTTENLIAETAAVLGISENFSTGDDGDFTFGFPQYYPVSVSAPADSPYATAIGGISLALNSDNSIKWQTGWGTNINEITFPGYVEDPPADGAFFNFGSGGGLSAFYAKPAYQGKLPGSGRHLPDISWLADPYTGGFIAISVPFAVPTIQYESIGGTSLSCPMFSALWAIANQEAGRPLGQAAPYLYYMPASTIQDILPYSSKHNVTGKVTDSNGTTSYSALSLVQPDQGTTTFLSTLWDYPLEPGFTLLLTFGTDSRLQTTVGYDNVTGLGVPAGKAFADYFHY